MLLSLAGKELVAQFLFALRLCWFPMILTSRR
jgi:hypothetical protein